MSASYNGIDRSPLVSTKRDEKDVGLPQPEGDISESANKLLVEELFDKKQSISIVNLPRIDIRPFLLRRNREKRIKLELKDCIVELFRDDLDELKRNFSKNIGTGAIISYCRVCRKKYTDVKDLEEHEKEKHQLIAKKYKKRVSFLDKLVIHHAIEYHSCGKCTKMFQCNNDLKRHMRKHKKRNCYSCNYCSKSFADRMFFKVHIKLHCDICGLLSESRKQYLEHRRQVCEKYKLFKCKICQNNFYSLLALNEHNYEHSDSSYYCEECKERCNTKCNLSYHISVVHKNELKQKYTSNESRDNNYHCNYCEVKTNSKDFIKEHVSLLDASDQLEYSCDQCGKNFATERELLQHKWSHFLVKNVDNDETKAKQEYNNKTETVNNNTESILYKLITRKDNVKIQKKISPNMNPVVLLERIDVDKYNFNQKPNLPDFIDVNNMEDFEYNGIKNVEDGSEGKVKNPRKKTMFSEHRCNICGRYFAQSSCIPRHMKEVHFLYDELKCRTCMQEFDDIEVMENHRCMIVLPLTRKLATYQCDICTKSFTTNYALVRHKNAMHSDLGMCKVCSTTFQWPSDFKDHKCQLPADKQLMCNICKKSYSSNYCLNRHMKVVHSDYDNLTCVVCSVCFNSANQLRHHRCETPYDFNFMCQICSKVYPSNFSLNRHKLTHFIDQICRVCHVQVADVNEMRLHRCEAWVGDEQYTDAMMEYQQFSESGDNEMDDIPEFEMPAPIVELTEYEGTIDVQPNFSDPATTHKFRLPGQDNTVKYVLQEVPVQFEI